MQYFSLGVKGINLRLRRKVMMNQSFSTRTVTPFCPDFAICHLPFAIVGYPLVCIFIVAIWSIYAQIADKDKKLRQNRFLH